MLSKTQVFISFLSAFLLATVFPVFAATGLKGDACVFGDDKTKGVVTLQCIVPLFSTIVNWALIFAGVVALFFIIFSGYKFLTSGGDPKQTEGARKTLTWAIVGLILILMSFAIVRFVADVTGVQRITKFGFDECVEDSDCPSIKECGPNGKCVIK